MDQSNERSQTYLNPKTQAYEIRDPHLLYPEYLMFTRPSPLNQQSPDTLDVEIRQCYDQFDEYLQQIHMMSHYARQMKAMKARDSLYY